MIVYVQVDVEILVCKFFNVEDFIYLCISNFMVCSLEVCLFVLEGIEGVIVMFIGMSVILLFGMGVFKLGDYVVCLCLVFGLMINFFVKEFGKFGVEISFVFQIDLVEWWVVVWLSIKFFFVEMLINLLIEVCDICVLVDMVYVVGVIFVVDNIYLMLVLQWLVELGVDIVMYLVIKYMDGQGCVMVGVLCGLNKWICDVFGFILWMVGMILVLFNVWVVLKGFEMLLLCMKVQSE